jgi:myo-inositol-1(or 4)-monophosphatase
VRGRARAGAILRERLRASACVDYKGGHRPRDGIRPEGGGVHPRRARTPLPGHGWLGEESGAGSGGEFRWVVDPLDGTTNFAHAYPFFAVSIALEVRGERTLGVVYDP